MNVNQIHFLSSAPNPVSLAQVLGYEVDRDMLLGQLVDAITTSLETYSPAYDTSVSLAYMRVLYRSKGFHDYFDVLAQESIRAEVVGDACRCVPIQGKYEIMFLKKYGIFYE